jgi:pyrroloquinoline-quinone synthase
LPEGPARRAVLTNAFEEEADGRSHADLWRDFISGVRDEARRDGSQEAVAALPEISALVATFREMAETATPAAAIAAFHAYESQVPRIAQEKRRGLRDHYAADAATCEYFRIHETADIHHAQVWTGLLDRELEAAATHGPAALASCKEEILRGTEAAAHALWTALDGIEAARTQLAA